MAEKHKSTGVEVTKKRAKEILAPFCHSRDTEFLKPFRLGRWAVATNRISLVAIESAGRKFKTLAEKGYPELERGVRRRLKDAVRWRGQCTHPIPTEPAFFDYIDCHSCGSTTKVYDPVEIGGEWVSSQLVGQIRRLGNTKTADRCTVCRAVPFRFDLGVGLVMPLSSPVSREGHSAVKPAKEKEVSK